MKTEIFRRDFHALFLNDFSFLPMAVFALFCLLAFPVHGQDCSKNVSYFPDQVLVLTSGNKGALCQNVFELEFEVPLTEEEDWPGPDFASSWLCPDGHCSETRSLNDEGRVTHVRITRTDSVPRTGMGEVVRYSPYILVDNVDSRRPAPEWAIWHDGGRQCLQLRGERDAKIELWTMQGNHLRTFDLNENGEASIDTSVWQPGVYFVKLISRGKGIEVRKILML